MGRPLRIQAPDVTYHITSRTNGKKLFMKKKRDHKALCRCLERIRQKYGAKVYGFTPMGNHFHLILKLEDGVNLSQFMCEFKTAYAKHYNTSYHTSGHFWGDRFHSTIVQDDKHMLACLRYIDRNPVKAGLVTHPQNWSYTSYSVYAHGQKHEILLIHHHPIYLALASNEEKRQKLYLDFVTGESTSSDTLHGSLTSIQFYGSQEFVESILKNQ